MPGKLDASGYSAEELQKIAGVSPSPADASGYSDEELVRIATGGKDPGFLKSLDNSLKSAVAPVFTGLGNLANTITGASAAPARAAVYAAQNKENPFAAFGQQFGANPDLAPSGQQILAKAGVPDKDYMLPRHQKMAPGKYMQWLEQTDPSMAKVLKAKGMTGDEDVPTNPAKILGTAAEMAIDPINLLPYAGPALKLAGSGLKDIQYLNEVGAIGKGAKMLNAPKAVETAADVGKALELQPQRVQEAADTLGITPTKGMLATDMQTRGLESSLEQSPSIAGDLVRKEIEPVRQKMISVVSEATASKTAKTAEQIGDAIKDGIRDKLTKTYEPIKGIYADIDQHLPNIPVREKSKMGIVRSIHEYADGTLAGTERSLVKDVANNISQAKTVDQLKQIRTAVLAKMRNGVASESAALRPIVDKLNRAISTNTMIAASQLEKQGVTGAVGAGKNLVETLKTVNKDYRGFIQEVQNYSSKSGVSKRIEGVEDFLDKLDEIPSAALGDKIFKSNDIKFLNSFKAQFPQEFELLRQKQLSDIFAETLTKTPQGIETPDPGKFIKAINKLQPETRAIIFGPEFKGPIAHEKALEALDTLVKSFPHKMGPSGTPQGNMFVEFLSAPRFQTKELTRYGLYKGDKQISNQFNKLTAPDKALMNRLSVPLPSAAKAAGSNAVLNTGSAIERRLNQIDKNKK